MYKKINFILLFILLFSTTNAADFYVRENDSYRYLGKADETRFSGNVGIKIYCGFISFASLGKNVCVKSGEDGNGSKVARNIINITLPNISEAENLPTGLNNNANNIGSNTNNSGNIITRLVERVIQVAIPGPQGPKGEKGADGQASNSGSSYYSTYTTSSQYNGAVSPDLTLNSLNVTNNSTFGGAVTNNGPVTNNATVTNNGPIINNGNVIINGTSTFNGPIIADSASITDLVFQNATGTNLVLQNGSITNLYVATGTFASIFTDLIQAVTGIFQNLYASIANFGDTNTGTLTSTGTTNLFGNNTLGSSTTTNTFNGTNNFTSTSTFAGPTDLNGQTNIASTTIANANINNLTLNPIASGTPSEPILVRDPITGEVRQITASELLASNTTNVINYSTSTGANLITSTVNGVISTTAITEMNSIKLTGTTTTENIQNSGNIISNLMSAVYGYFTNLFFDNATGTNIATTNITATGTANLATINTQNLNAASGTLGSITSNASGTNITGTTTISGPLFATNTTFGGDTTINGGTTTITGVFVNNAETINNGTTTNNGITINNGEVINNSTTTQNGNLVMNGETINNGTTTNNGPVINNGTTTFTGPSVFTGTSTFTGVLDLSNASVTFPNGPIPSATITNLVFENATGTNLSLQNASISNATVTNLFTDLLNAFSAFFTNLTATNATITNLVTDTATFGPGTTTITGPLALSSTTLNSMADNGLSAGADGKIELGGALHKDTMIDGILNAFSLDFLNLNKFNVIDARSINLSSLFSNFITGHDVSIGAYDGSATSSLNLITSKVYNVLANVGDIPVLQDLNGKIEFESASNILASSTTNTISSTGNVITSNVNGKVSTTTTVNSNVISYSTGTKVITSTVNGVVATTTLNVQSPLKYYAEDTTNPIVAPVAGTYSVAIGDGANAGGSQAFGIGTNALSNGTQSFAIGTNVSSSGNGSYAIGEGAVTIGDASYGFGRQNIINNANSYSIGYSNTSNADSAYVFGQGNTVESANSYTIGDINVINNTAAIESIAIGQRNTVSLSNGYILGHDNLSATDGANEFIIGYSNSSYSGSSKDNYIIGESNNLSNYSGSHFINLGSYFNDTGLGSGSMDRVGVIGFNNRVTTSANDSFMFGVSNTLDGVSGSYILGSNIINNVSGTVDIGTSNATKVTVDGGGRLTLRGALNVTGSDGNSGDILISQGGSVMPIWQSPASILAGATTNVLGFATSTNVLTSVVNGVIATTSLANMNCTSSTSIFCQNGNSFGTTAVLGTNDAQQLAFETNNTQKMWLNSTGELVYGTSAAGAFGGNGFTLRNASQAIMNGTLQAYDSLGNQRVNIDPNGSFGYVVGANVPVTASTSRNLFVGGAPNISSPTFFVRGDGMGYFGNSVGIGTASPNGMLDVRGYTYINNLRINGTDTSNTIFQQNPNSDLAITTNSTLSTVGVKIGGGSGVPVLNVMANNMVGIGTSAPGNALHIASSSGSISGLRLAINSSTAAATGTGKFLAVNANGDVYQSNLSGLPSLAVGTTTLPAGKVATFQGDIDVTGTIDPTRILFSNLAGINSPSYNPSANGNNYSMRFEEGGNLNFQSDTTNNILHLANGGNVAIGTSTAGYKFNVVDTSSPFVQTLVQGGAAGGGVLTRLQNNTREYAIGVGGSVNSTLGADALFIRDMTSGINRIVVASTTGNVGIGSFTGTMPARRLEVLDSSGNIARFGWNATDFLDIVAGGVETRLESSGTRPFKIRTNGVDRITVLSSGNVGIGTLVPATKLQVNGDIRVGTSGGNGCLQDFAGTAIAGTCSSDENLKTNIVELDQDILSKKFENIKFVEYNWNNLAANVYAKSTSSKAVGVLAQNVAEQFPELVSTDDKGYKVVDMTTLNWYALASLKNTIKNVEGIAETFSTSTISGLEAISIATSTSINPFANISVAETLVSKINEGSKFITNFIAVQVTAVKAYFDEIFTRKVCFVDATGETCLDKAKVDQLLNGQPVNQPNITQIDNATNTNNVSTTATSTQPNTNADVEAPGINLNGDSTVTIELGNTYIDAGATAFDTVDGDVSTKILITNNVDTNVIGSYEVVYTVVDNAGNIASKARTINVVAPAIVGENSQEVSTSTIE